MNSGQPLSSNELRSFPKVELHRHLEGSLRIGTLLELASAVDKNQFLITSPMQDLETVLKKFMSTQAVLKSPEILSRITYEAIEDAVSEGIRILELRYAPSFIEEGHSFRDWNQIHEAILQGLKWAKDLPISVGFLAIIQRTKGERLAHSVIDFVREYKDSIVGVDLADNEDSAEPAIFANVFAKAQQHGIPITIHAGEAKHPRAAQRVREAIEILGAQRIGHGLQVFEDDLVMRFLRERGIPLEICPTSNWITNNIESLTEHPIRKLMEHGVPVTINSDDPGIFGIDLTNEYELLSRFYSFTERDFNLANDIAAQASFIPLIKKQKYWPRPIHLIR